MNNQILKSLSIKNFRSYKDEYIEFHPEVNVIVGGNDAGKSNLRRALDLVIQNQPGTDDYISDWGGDLDIQLGIGNKTVGRFRNVVWNKKEEKWKAGTENLYTLSGEKEPFRSFGRGKVPDIIKSFINISSLNMSSQWDNFFLLDKTPPDVAKHYNSLVNLEIIDKALSNISSTLKREKRELKVEKALVKKKTKELKEFDWIANAEKDLSKLEKLNNYIKHLNSQWSDLAGMINNLERLEKQNQELSEITKYEKIVKDLGIKSIEITVLKARRNELCLLIDNYKLLKIEQTNLKEKIQYQNDVESLIKQAKQIDNDIEKENELRGYIEQLKEYQEAEKRYKSIIKYANEVDALLVLDNEIEKGISRYNLLQELLENRLRLSQEQEILKGELKELDNEFEVLMPETCPLCGK